MTTSLRSLSGVIFAALLALSLVVTTVDAMASTVVHDGGLVRFDQGFVDRSIGLFNPRPVGRFGVSWE